MNKQTYNTEQIESAWHESARSVKLEFIKLATTMLNDAIKEHLLPSTSLPQKLHKMKYTNENEMINKLVFCSTSRQWRKQNPELAAQGKTIRDVATDEQLQLLFTLISENIVLIKQDLPKEERLVKLYAKHDAVLSGTVA